VERIADALKLTGILIPITSLLAGIFLLIGQEESILTVSTVWGLGFLVFLYCHAARYILVDVTSDMRKEMPNVVGRIGQVLYWFGCAVGILSMPVGVLAWIGEGSLGDPADSLPALLLCLAIGAAAWIVGRTARYILKGD
jgi:hypothetical protein